MPGLHLSHPAGPLTSAVVRALTILALVSVALLPLGETAPAAVAVPFRDEPGAVAAPPVIVPGTVLRLKPPPPEPKVESEPTAEASPEAEEVTGDLVDDVEDVLTEPQISSTTTSFNVSSFNVLGASHSKKRGKASGSVRARWAADLLRSNGVSVAGLQEFQMPQVTSFKKYAPEFGVYPGGALGPALSHNSIVWNTGTWELLRAETTKIPYFRGNRLPMPHVLLRNRASGQQVWFMNYHNPADVRGPAQRWRNLATSIEASLARRLMNAGTPVIMTGDFNDRAPFLCQVTRQAPLHSADGGRTTGGKCVTPRRMNVDWILGSASIKFSAFITDRSALVNRTSDHPMIRSRVTIG